MEALVLIPAVAAVPAEMRRAFAVVVDFCRLPRLAEMEATVGIVTVPEMVETEAMAEGDRTATLAAKGATVEMAAPIPVELLETVAMAARPVEVGTPAASMERLPARAGPAVMVAMAVTAMVLPAMAATVEMAVVAALELQVDQVGAQAGPEARMEPLALPEPTEMP